MSRPEPPRDDDHAQHDFTGPLSPPVKRLIRALMATCALLFALDLFISRETHAPGEGFPGFYAIYGFVGCVFLVLAAKLLRRVVMRPEDYWDPPVGDAVADEDADDDDPGGDR